jgi:hypothetical protein
MKLGTTPFMQYVSILVSIFWGEIALYNGAFKFNGLDLG